jgi:hypothetical protein
MLAQKNSALQFRKIVAFEGMLAKVPGAMFGDACAPLEHTFGDNLYIRQITMPAGMILTSKIHKTTHPYFIMRGDVSVITEEGKVRIKGPYWGMTKAGTKRVLKIHEETVWITVHSTKETDLEKIEHDLIRGDMQ